LFGGLKISEESDDNDDDEDADEDEPDERMIGFRCRRRKKCRK
jgi:hypothetical protein